MRIDRRLNNCASESVVGALRHPFQKVLALIYSQRSRAATLGKFKFTRNDQRGVFAAAKLLPLVVLIVLGIWFVDPGQLSVAVWPEWKHWGEAMVLVLFAYAGMESALVPTGEVRNPGKTVPRAAMIATLFVIALYLGLQVTAQGVLGAALAGDRTPIASTAGALWGPGFSLLLVGAGISMLGYLQGNVLGNSRLLYALGRDGLLPAAIGRVHERTRVPHIAVLVHAGVAAALAVSGDFATLALVSGGAVGLLYLLTGTLNMVDLAGRLGPEWAEHSRAIVAALREALKKGTDKGLIGNKGYRKYVKTPAQKAFVVDEQKIKEEARYDGLWALQTNMDLETEMVARTYKHLWTVEDLFRTMKSALATRPIYHKLDATIRGHVFCSFLALRLRRELEDRLEKLGKEWEWAEILRGLDQLSEVTLAFQGKKFLMRSELKGHASQAVRAAGVALPPPMREAPPDDQ